MTAGGPPPLPQIRPRESMPERYYDAYCAAAHMRQSTREAARTWYSLGVAAEVAGAWGRRDFTPEQGWHWMNRDVTPEHAGQLDKEGKT